MGRRNGSTQKPTMLENLRFSSTISSITCIGAILCGIFGKANDIQGDGGITKGNWITGIPFIDDKVLGLGPQDNIAPDVADNKGRNTYLCCLSFWALSALYINCR